MASVPQKEAPSRALVEQPSRTGEGTRQETLQQPQQRGHGLVKTCCSTKALKGFSLFR